LVSDKVELPFKTVPLPVFVRILHKHVSIMWMECEIIGVLKKFLLKQVFASPLLDMLFLTPDL
jgi:hypothetical protein